MDPGKEYASRLARWSREAEHYDRQHRWTGNLRLLFGVGLLVAAVLLRDHVAIGLLFAGVVAGLFLSGMVHDRILENRDTARRLMRFYQAGLDRLGNRWAGKGSGGTEYLDKEHPYAGDLDVFGMGSLFELVNTTQTKAGGTRLARWLLNGAEPEEIMARQTAVEEMRNKMDLREDLAMQAGNKSAHIDTDALLSWTAQPHDLANPFARIAAFCLPLVTWSFFAMGKGGWFLLALTVQCGFGSIYRRRTVKSLSKMKLPAQALQWLSNLLGRSEREPFGSPRLTALQARWKRDGRASESLRRLARLVDWLDARDNYAVALIGPLFLLGTQFAFALEAWRTRNGAMIEDWLMALGEMEALSSLGGYAYEHPMDVFPELIVNCNSPLIEAQGLAHPLLSESIAMRNDIVLDATHRLHVISGSNMSGKSTWLRAIGTNVVLAMAGAPVRARKFRMTPLQIGASIRTLDSLQEGVSRFYAEIKRLRQIIDLTDNSGRVLFLIDEVLGGTNSHDRQIGAAFIVKALVTRGAVGLITTHDLALTRIAEELNPAGENFHFEDQLVNGKLSFDYQLQPGIVKKSNALDLMRSIGLDV